MDNNRKIKLAVDDQAMDWLASAGYSRESYWVMANVNSLTRFLSSELRGPANGSSDPD